MMRHSISYFWVSFLFIYSISWQEKSLFAKKLNLKEEQKIDREIIVEGTDEFLFFSTKEKLKAELSSSPSSEKWQEQNDPILWATNSVATEKSLGKISFSYGNRNFFHFATNYHDQIGKTLLALDLHHRSFSHIDIKQQKKNSAQADSDLFFATKSKIHKKYNLLFSFSGKNRHNRLPDFSAYQKLNKRLFTFSLGQEILPTPFSHVLLDLKGSYAYGNLTNFTTTNSMQLGRAEFSLRSHNLLKKMNFDFLASAGYFYNQQPFKNAVHNYYSFFSLLFDFPLWQTVAGKNPWQGNLVLELGGGSFLSDYTVLSRITLSGRLADWVSTFEFLFEKKYSQIEHDWLQHRYRFSDKALLIQKIETWWKNKIPLSQKNKTKIILQIDNEANYFFKGRQFFWNNKNSLWQYIPFDYFSVSNSLGILFSFSSVFSWSTSVTYHFFKPQIYQFAPLGFLTELRINSQRWLFVLGYRLHGVRIDSVLQKELPMVHLLYSELEWKIHSRFSLTLRGRNLLNQKYYWLVPFFEPDLTVAFGISVRL